MGGKALWQKHGKEHGKKIKEINLQKDKDFYKKIRQGIKFKKEPS